LGHREGWMQPGPEIPLERAIGRGNHNQREESHDRTVDVKRERDIKIST